MRIIKFGTSNNVPSYSLEHVGHCKCCGCDFICQEWEGTKILVEAGMPIDIGIRVNCPQCFHSVNILT